MRPKIDVLIPAYNEEATIGKVVKEFSQNFIRKIVVVDNASRDKTAEIASKNGATTVFQPQKGYGSACLAGIEFLKNEAEPPEILVFVDADGSDDPEDLAKILAPILENRADFVIGSRMLGEREKGSMTFPQKFGNWLAPALIKWFWGVKFTDLGPFRAIRFESLLLLKMEDKDFGWTVEMQIKAAKSGLQSLEVPVRYRKRAGGKSKVSGTIRGTFLASKKIIWTIFKSLTD
jgi:glycosyltransferase involved in cell wall biosynthesis